MLTFRETKKDQYLGGVLSIARNLSQFTDKVSVLSMIGQNKEHLNEIKKFLPKTIKTNFIFKENSPTIVKRDTLMILVKANL